MKNNELNVRIAKENRRIVKTNQYEYKGKLVNFQYSLKDHQRVQVITPEMIDYYMESFDKEDGEIEFNLTNHCTIRVVNTSSFDVDSDLVLNFANARHPGGGYKHGANAQEETLCRQSTLYASISSKEAQTMYEYNTVNRHPMESDYMLLSPCVEVFRDNEMNTLAQPRTVAVLTSPAPNMNGAAKGWPEDEVGAYMINRIRAMAVTAAANGYRRLTLGAWGCGAFGHDAFYVSHYFYQVFEEEMFCMLFDSVTFAVYDNTPNRYNYRTFDKFLEHNGNMQRQETVVSKGKMPCLRIDDSKVSFGEDLGYAQGIMSDGTSFIAEVYHAEGTDSTEIHVVIPARAIATFDRKTSTREYDSDNLRWNWDNVICKDITERREICESECMEEIIACLYRNDIIEKTDNICCYAGCGKDLMGQEVIMVAMTLSDQGKQYAQPLIQFRAFQDPENKFVINNL